MRSAKWPQYPGAKIWFSPGQAITLVKLWSMNLLSRGQQHKKNARQHGIALFIRSLS